MHQRILHRVAASKEASIPTSRSSNRGVRGRKVEGVQCVAAVEGAAEEVEPLGEVVFSIDLIRKLFSYRHIMIFMFTLFGYVLDLILFKQISIIFKFRAEFAL